MKELFLCVQKYKNQMNLMDFGLLKICLLSMGILMGIGVPKRCKKRVAACTSVVFAFTYAPLITKLLGIVAEDSKKAINNKG